MIPAVASPGKPGGEDALLAQALRRLGQENYRFVTPTPATHARVVSRPDRRIARDLADIFGWNLPFRAGLLPPGLESMLDAAGLFERPDGLLRARLRVASLGRRLFFHSAFPTDAADAVFFGPDSYRFADLVRAGTRGLRLPERPRILDIGCGTGVGALVAAEAFPDAELWLTDINSQALRLARINAAAAGAAVHTLEAADPAEIGGEADLVVANPPYLSDEAKRSYRDGGDMHGAAVPLAMAEAGTAMLGAGGRMIFYSGSAIVSGEDRLAARLAALAQRRGLSLSCREIDPDVFGEELERPAYADVDRIALIAAIFDRPA